MGLLSTIATRFKQGLHKTRETLSTGFRSLLGRRLDEALISELETMLLHADVGVAAVSRLIGTIRADFRAGKVQSSEQVLDYLKRELKAMLGGPGTALAVAPSGPTVILVTGINGAGKTTSIAKLSAHLRAQDRKVIVAACDTFRAGAVRQLEIWSERLGVEVIKGQQGGDPAAVAFDAVKAAVSRHADYLIIDTAGRLHTQDPLMRQLAKIRSVITKQVPGGPHETLLVLDATTGQNALRQAQEFDKSAGVTGIILAKLDGTAKGGIVVAIRGATDIPVKFVGVGERPEDLEPFDPDAFVEALFAE